MIRVIRHDQYGEEMSHVSYDDVADECDYNSNSEPSSPDTLKKDSVLFAPDLKQGAARLDYVPKSNIIELILGRKDNHISEESRHRSSGELLGKSSSKIRDNVLVSRNLQFCEKGSPPQSPFPPLPIISTTQHQLPNISSNTYLSSNFPLFSNNHGSSMIPFSTGPIGSQRQTSKFMFSSSNSSIDHQHYKDNSIFRNTQNPRQKLLSNSSNSPAGGQFTGQYISPLSISTTSTSLTPNNIIHNDVPDTTKNALIKQEKPEVSSLKTSNFDCLTPCSNSPFISRNLSGPSNIIIPNCSNRVKLDSHDNDVSKGLFLHPQQNNQLQPQFPLLNQVDPLNNSQILSISNQASEEYQTPSQPVSTSCIQLPHLNGLHTLLNNNIIVAPLQENRLNNVHPTPSVSNPLEAIPYTFEHNKQVYQQYLSYLQNQFYTQQLNALILSQMQSPTQPIHAHMAQAQMNLQISQSSQLPSHVNSSENQSAGIRAQVQSLPLPGTNLFSNDSLTQLSTYPFANDLDPVTINTKNSEKN
ncbi:hypothetical protein LOD99_2152 [Oopsacas minuta]|uniref:Uncharacterized protein n=1 Tax=Oopsacas minuta TaxID=111878 RepID=A0AAV7K2C2_9METZ|nr:hypothetical protein LOD99_2152 [Oopsacas minuta]